MGLLCRNQGPSILKDTRMTTEVVLFSDQGEAMSEKVEEECCKYGVKRETTTGYTPQHKCGDVKMLNASIPND